MKTPAYGYGKRRDPRPKEAANQNHADREDDLRHGHGHDVAVADRGDRGDGPVEGVQIPGKAQRANQ